MAQDCHIASIKVFTRVAADRQGRVILWVTPGWYRRTTDPISLIPIRGWRLWRHRLLWGFSGLVDARDGSAHASVEK
jgi:hypothetical protein